MSLVSSSLSGMKGVTSAGIKRIGVGGAIAAGGFGLDTVSRVKQGQSLGTSLFKSGVENIGYAVNPGLMATATIFAPLAVQGTKAAHTFRRQRGEDLSRAKYSNFGVVGGNYMDTMQAQTMRQAAVQQIQGNKLNARSALGGEARIFSNKHF